jgi:hypothetical protein
VDMVTRARFYDGFRYGVILKELVKYRISSSFGNMWYTIQCNISVIIVPPSVCRIYTFSRSLNYEIKEKKISNKLILVQK